LPTEMRAGVRSPPPPFLRLLPLKSKPAPTPNPSFRSF